MVLRTIYTYLPTHSIRKGIHRHRAYELLHEVFPTKEEEGSLMTSQLHSQASGHLDQPSVNIWRDMHVI